jgi:putative oxidoreductase
MNWKKAIPFVTSVMLVLLFTYTALDKLSNISIFEYGLKAQVFHSAMIPALKWGIPLAELLIVILLLVPPLNRTGIVAGTFLMLGFTVYILLVLSTVFSKVPCACAGVFRTITWHQQLALNLIVLIPGILSTAFIWRGMRTRTV